MSNKLYVFLVLGAVALSGCQRQQIGGFMPSRHEPFARTTPARVTTPAPEAVEIITLDRQAAQASESSAFLAQPQPVEPALVLTAQASGQLTAGEGTRTEARAAKVNALLEKIRTNGSTAAAPQKTNFAQKAFSKIILKKVNKQIAKEKQGKSTQALNRDIRIGLILLIVGLVLALLINPTIIGSVVAVVGLVFLLIGLINQA